jgi:hypothetical protein
VWIILHFAIGGGLLLAVANYVFLRHTMNNAYEQLHISGTCGKVIFLFFCLLLLFGFPAFRMEITHFGPWSKILGLIMYLTIPFMLKIFWPSAKQ